MATFAGDEDPDSGLARARRYLQESRDILKESKQDLDDCLRLHEKNAQNRGNTVNGQMNKQKSFKGDSPDDDDEPSDDEGNLYKKFNEDQNVSMRGAKAFATDPNLVPDQALLNELFEDDDHVDFLIATDNEGGKLKSNLKTMLPNEFSVKVLKPDERRKLLTKQKTARDLRVLEEKDEKLKEQEAIIKAIHKEGWLLKTPSTQKIFASPRRRWFVLSGSVLVYLASKLSKVPRNMIDLLGAQVEAVKNPKGPTGYEVRLLAIVKTPAGLFKKRYRFCTATPEEAVAWCSALKNNIEYAKQQELKRREKVREKQGKGELARKDTTRRRQSLVGMDITIRLDEPPKTFYDLLKLGPSATDAALKKVYRELAVNYHPDKNPDIKPDEFAEISRAYAVLKDPEKRAQYDLSLRVKSALRLGIVAKLHGDALEPVAPDGEDNNEKEETEGAKMRDQDEDMNSTNNEFAFFVDEKFQLLIWQDKELGTTLKEGYRNIELRFVQKIFAGQNYQECPEEIRSKSIVLHGMRMGCPDMILEFETESEMEEILDGLRIIRCDASMLFQQNLDKMLEEGFR